jgi:hypothetical protein
MSNKLIKTEKATITSLFAGKLETAVPLEQLNVILSTPPPETWVKEHPFVKGHKYLPIDKVEYLLRRCFKRYRIEVIKTGMLMNAIEVTVRVHYFNPATGTMEFHDGVGACELQTTKGSGGLKLDMSNVNKGAVTMALPIAKTIAIKDACDHFGDLFGANLNRKDVANFKGDAELLTAEGVNDQKEAKRIADFISRCYSVESLNNVSGYVERYGLTEIFNAKLKEVENG